jgi:hypothetical protein
LPEQLLEVVRRREKRVGVPNRLNNAAKLIASDMKRDDYEALEAAVPDLIRLERYERRAWSRQKRAIREFVALHFDRNSRSSAA